jgi:hypothetical protein
MKMCTSIIEVVRAEGMAKRESEWFRLSHSVVAYDHARHAALGDVITLDFMNVALDPGARAGVELTLESRPGNYALRSTVPLRPLNSRRLRSEARALCPQSIGRPDV